MLCHVRSLYCRDTEYISIIALLSIRGSFYILTVYDRIYLGVIEKSSLSFCHLRMDLPLRRVARGHFPFSSLFFRSADTVGSGCAMN